jgi:hypothetical protein
VSAAGQSVSQGLGSRAKPVGEEERRRRLTGRRARGGGGAPAVRVGVEPERGGDAAVHVELHIESAATKSLGTRPPAFAVGSKAAPRDARVATSNSH